MKKLGFLTIFTLIFTITGCGDSACYNKLREADSLSEKGFTDSAQKVLESIEQTYKIKDGKAKAYYSLLKYQLQFRFQYENGGNLTDSNLINYSISYYSKNIDNRKLALSYYLKSRTSKDRDAIIYLKKAEEAMKETNDDFLKARITYQISIINTKNENYNSALKYGLAAIEHCKKTDDYETLSWCYITLSYIYNNMSKPDSCIFYVDKCLKYSDKIPQEQMSYVYTNLASHLEDIDPIRAKEYALKSLEIRKSNNAYQILAKIARDNKDYKQSEAYLNEALKYSPSIDWEAFILYELAQTKTLMGQHEEAARISKEVHRLRDSVEYIHAQDSIKELQMAADLNYKNQAVVEEKENRTAVIASVLTIIIIVTLGAYIRKRRKLKRSIADSEQKEDEYKSQIKTIEEKSRTVEEEKRMVEEKNKEMEKENRKKGKEIETAKRKAEKARSEKEAAQKETENIRKKAQKQQEKMKAEEEKRMMEKDRRYRAGMDIYNKVAAGTSGSIYWDKETEISFVEYYQLISPMFKKAVDNKYAGMTERNLAILAMKDMGLTNAAIAKTLNISDGAVRTQISRMNKGTKDDTAEE